MAFEGTLQEFTVSMHGNTLEHTFIEVQQGDTASRKIRVHLKTFGGADFLIPYGATAVLSVNKSDGHKILNECEIEDSSTVIITLTSQTIACPGMQLSQIYIFTDDWDIKTQKFYIHAPKAAYDGDAIKSTDEFGVLVETLNRVKQLEEDNERINEAEEERVAAFEERIEKMDQATSDANTAADKANAIADQLINDLTKRSNAIVQTVSGESIVATDSSDDPLRCLRVFGKTEQVTTTGAQLFDKDNAEYVIGVSYNSVEEGFIDNNNTYLRTYYMDAEPNTSYFISKSVGNNFRVCACSEIPAIGVKTTNVNADTTKNSCVITTGANDRYIALYLLWQAEYDSGITYESVLDTLMVAKGTVEVPYEPYTGGIQSPNSQYLQELDSKGKDGSIEVGVYGGKLLDLTKFGDLSKNGSVEKNGITFTNVNDEYIKVVGTATGYANIHYNTHLPNGTYILSGLKDSKLLLRARVFRGNTSTDYACDKPFTVTDDVTLIQIIIQADTGWTVDNVIYPMLNAGSVALPYEPYKEPQSLPIATPNGLPGIKVTDASLANYTDSDGNMWCSDEVDFERGVYVQRIGQYSLLDAWSITQSDNSAHSSDILRFDFVNVFGAKTYSPILCNRFIFRFAHNEDFATVRALEDISTHSNSDMVSVFIDKNRLETPDVDGFKKWLQENETNIQVVLTAPIETPLSEEELTAYRALHSNYPVTTILNDEGVHMEVKYNADTSTYIAQNYVPKSAYTELEARVLALETNAVS